ncbi:unnamed protein product [Brugia pahangi]|uniref:Uncharacterized protein n=1 Tax=Brugia pahangi TaxID=6280 RepID=A0A0N4THC4_BRUPA|nr:unnamed protein product [Brugia pahangi]
MANTKICSNKSYYTCGNFTINDNTNNNNNRCNNNS